MGMQMGEYYGFSLLAVDLNGDKWVIDPLTLMCGIARAPLL